MLRTATGLHHHTRFLSVLTECLLLLNLTRFLVLADGLASVKPNLQVGQATRLSFSLFLLYIFQALNVERKVPLIQDPVILISTTIDEVNLSTMLLGLDEIKDTVGTVTT